MKRLATVALAVALVLPVCAQRSASHGGFSYRSAPVFRGGLASPRASSFAAPARYAGNRYFNSAPTFRRGSPGNFEIHPNENWRRLYRPRRPRRMAYGARAYGTGIYVVPGGTGWIDTGWIGPDSVDTGDTAEPTGYDDSGAAPDDAAGGYDAGPPERAWPTLYGYSQRPNVQQPHTPSVPDSEEAVTLIFKDGRPSEQIHNYAMTATMLYVLDTPYRNIPLDLLNLPATTKLNDDAGVNFQLPQTSK